MSSTCICGSAHEDSRFCWMPQFNASKVKSQLLELRTQALRQKALMLPNFVLCDGNTVLYHATLALQTALQ
jgi:hypothetical protein